MKRIQYWGAQVQSITSLSWSLCASESRKVFRPATTAHGGIVEVRYGAFLGEYLLRLTYGTGSVALPGFNRFWVCGCVLGLLGFRKEALQRRQKREGSHAVPRDRE